VRGTGHADVAGECGEQHVVLVPAQCPQGEEQRLLAADGDHNGLRADLDVLVDGQVLRDEVVDDPLGPAVLQDQPAHHHLVVAMPRHGVVAVPFEVVVHVVEVEESLVGPACRERDGVRVLVRDLVEEVHRLGDRRVQRVVKIRQPEQRTGSGSHDSSVPRAASIAATRLAGRMSVQFCSM
jgi:hypothetical protein